MSLRWTDKSRHNSLREYEISETTLTVKCRNVSYYSFTENNEIRSVDPDGGPYLAIGTVVGKKWIIKRIVSHKKKRRDLIVVFEVDLNV
jgi:glutamine synthetase